MGSHCTWWAEPGRGVDAIVSTASTSVSVSPAHARALPTGLTCERTLVPFYPTTCTLSSADALLPGPHTSCFAASEHCTPFPRVAVGVLQRNGPTPPISISVPLTCLQRYVKESAHAMVVPGQVQRPGTEGRLGGDALPGGRGLSSSSGLSRFSPGPPPPGEASGGHWASLKHRRCHVNLV